MYLFIDDTSIQSSDNPVFNRLTRAEHELIHWDKPSFRLTRDILGRWGTGGPGPVEGGLRQESGMQQVQAFQSLQELRQQQQALDLLET